MNLILINWINCIFFQDLAYYFYFFIAGKYNHAIKRKEEGDYLHQTADDYIYGSHYDLFEAYRIGLKLTEQGKKKMRWMI